MLGIGHEQYRRYERGSTEPSLAVLTTIRRVVGVSLDILVAGEQPGSTTMIDAHGAIRRAMSLSDRLRIARQAIAPGLSAAAELMHVDVARWERWEAGEEEPPLEVLVEFSHRFGVGLDFLYRGQNTGVAPQVWSAMVRVCPELEAPEPLAVPSPRRRSRKATNGGKPGPKGKVVV
jgi:transcriptional regulator with XRE-family HTH domain